MSAEPVEPLDPVGHAEAIGNVITICGIERIISDETVGTS